MQTIDGDMPYIYVCVSIAMMRKHFDNHTQQQVIVWLHTLLFLYAMYFNK